MTAAASCGFNSETTAMSGVLRKAMELSTTMNTASTNSEPAHAGGRTRENARVEAARSAVAASATVMSCRHYVRQYGSPMPAEPRTEKGDVADLEVALADLALACRLPVGRDADRKASVIGRASVDHGLDS